MIGVVAGSSRRGRAIWIGARATTAAVSAGTARALIRPPRGRAITRAVLLRQEVGLEVAAPSVAGLLPVVRPDDRLAVAEVQEVAGVEQRLAALAERLARADAPRAPAGRAREQRRAAPSDLLRYRVRRLMRATWPQSALAVSADNRPRARGRLASGASGGAPATPPTAQAPRGASRSTASRRSGSAATGASA